MKQSLPTKGSVAILKAKSGKGRLIAHYDRDLLFFLVLTSVPIDIRHV
jgi:hypothetical protein